MKVVACWSPGAGSGIGQATALRLLSEGARVVGADISEAGLADLGEKAGADADRLEVVTINIGDEQSVVAGVARAVEVLGGLDGVVNAAGILRSGHTHEMSLADFQTVININLIGTFLVIREALPALIAAEGAAVVNFSSTSAGFAHPYMAAYAASKGGIQSMTHTLALEYSKQNVRFTSVQPGSISSGMTDGSGQSKQSVGPGLPEDVDWSLFAKLQPVLGAGFAGPETVAGVVAMLLSDDGAFITGTEVRIDGGATSDLGSSSTAARRRSRVRDRASAMMESPSTPRSHRELRSGRHHRRRRLGRPRRHP